MTLLVPTATQIRAQLDAILKQDPRVRTVGIRSPGREAWPESVTSGGRRFDLVWCESSLAARAAMMARPDEHGLVVLTALPEAVLGDDLIARFAKARLLRVEAWEMVREAFQAVNIDQRLSGKSWMAELLLDAAHDPFPPAGGGFLDADTAWRHLLARTLDLSAARPDADMLLRWTVGDGNLARFEALPAEARKGIAARLTETAGPVGDLVTRCVLSGFGADALPLGLTAGVIFAEGWTSRDLTEAAVRLEPYVGGLRISADHGRAWADAAARTLGTLRIADESRALLLLQRADALLIRLHAAEHAASSPILLSGFDARLERLAAAVGSFVDGSAGAEEIEAASAWALAHEEARVQPERAESVMMATRLARWLSQPDSSGGSFAEMAARYAEEGAFVDWARSVLLGGDDLPALNAAYASLVAAARTRRESWNLAFARALAAWRPEPGPTWPLVPVERVLEEIVAPIAREHPVLLLVMDGLSLAVLQELLPDLRRSGWMEMIPSGTTGAGCGVAALPTVTEISRASLLSGRLTRGGQSVEKSGFAEHPALRAASRAGRPPVLFHKGDLGRDGMLPEPVREAIDASGPQAVAIIYNAVDDQLGGSDQVRHRWRLAGSGVLRPILRAARDAGRVVIATADHGHLPEAGAQSLDGGDGERWRAPGGPLAAQEIAFSNGRVLTPSGGTEIVLPWSETVRYAAVKNGYHGGASPQEVLVPLTVLASAEMRAAWAPAPPIQPEWWDDPLPPPSPVAPKPARRKKVAPEPELADLFAGTAPPEPAAAPDWVDQLLASETYAAQKQLASRGAPQDEIIRKLLTAVSERGGKLGQVALAQRLAVPQIRVGGLIMAARRVLNVDQAPVLEIEEGSRMVVLNRELLDAQFELKR